MIKLYNQLTKKVEEFTPQDPSNVKIYTCGPTVYSYAHIGNFTSYIYWDLLIRLLTLSGYKVNRVLNLTDVGHLASDADDGEDKLEKGAKAEGKTVWEIAEKYIEAFLSDFNSLNLVTPTKIARATDYITEDEELVDKLTAGGYTYEISDGIYFDTSKFSTYADFAGLDLDNLKAGARVEFSSEKKNASDFAVWKYIHPGEDHAMRWEYNDKIGYPGWHLECATIIHAELGGTIDIHTGGIDHIPVHHTNEIAEYEAGYGEKLANFWLHNNFILIDGQKISKSLGNTYTLHDLADQGFSPLDYKLWVLQGHYKTERNFSLTDLAAAKNRRLNWRNRIAKLYQIENTASSFDSTHALELVSNDLNSAELLALIDNSSLSLNDWKFVDELLGLNLVESTPDMTQELADEFYARELARKNQDYTVADKIRADLTERNLTILDTADGPIWQFLA